MKNGIITSIDRLAFKINQLKAKHDEGSKLNPDELSLVWKLYRVLDSH